MVCKWHETRDYINLEEITKEQYEQIKDTAKVYNRRVRTYATLDDLVYCEVDVTGVCVELEKKIDEIIGDDIIIF